MSAMRNALSTERHELIGTSIVGKVCHVCEQFRGHQEYDTIGKGAGRIVCRRCLRAPDSLQDDPWGAYKARTRSEAA